MEKAACDKKNVRRFFTLFENHFNEEPRFINLIIFVDGFSLETPAQN